MAKPFVVLHAVWGNDDVDVYLKLLKREWLEIKSGSRVVHSSRYWYEAERYTADWLFNFPKAGELQIGYDDGGVGWIGRIDEIEATFQEKSVISERPTPGKGRKPRPK